MFNKKIILIYAAFLFVVLVVPNRITLAETRVYSTDVKNGWVWNEEGSPYILEESIYVPDNHTLYIREGVEVVSASPAEGDDPYSLTVDGDLMVQGSVEKPVVFEDLYTIFFSGSNSKIKNANFNGTGLEFVLSTSTIDSVEIKNSFSAITARGSKISVVNSKLENNGYGIAS